MYKTWPTVDELKSPDQLIQNSEFVTKFISERPLQSKVFLSYLSKINSIFQVFKEMDSLEVTSTYSKYHNYNGTYINYSTFNIYLIEPIIAILTVSYPNVLSFKNKDFYNHFLNCCYVVYQNAVSSESLPTFTSLTKDTITISPIEQVDAIFYSMIAICGSQTGEFHDPRFGVKTVDGQVNSDLPGIKDILLPGTNTKFFDRI